MELGELTKVVDEIVDDEIVDEKPKRSKRPTVAQMRELERQIAVYQRSNISLSERIDGFATLTRELQKEQEVIIAQNQKLREQIGMQLGDQREANEFVDRLRRKNDDLLRQIDHWHRVAASLISIMGPGFTGGE